MFQLIQLILQNITFFALHLKNLTSFPKPLSAQRERELLHKMKQNGDIDARNELIEHNLRLVSHIIKKYYSNYDEQEDLISISTIGLIKAIVSLLIYLILLKAIQNTRIKRDVLCNMITLPRLKDSLIYSKTETPLEVSVKIRF